MVADTASQPTSRDEFEIAIVCTRALEYDAVCLLLDKFWDTDGDPFGRARGDANTYTTGCMGKYNIVVVLLCNSGKATAAGAAASLRSSYPCIELLLLAGICEGVPNANGEELLLGDVVISETVIQYDLGTQFAVAFKEKDTLEDRHGRANKNIRSFTANMKTEIGYQRLEEKVALYLEQIQNCASETKYRRRRKATYMYPGSVNDILFEPAHCHKHYNSLQCVCADYNPDEDFYAVCDESKGTDCEQTGCKLNPLKTRDRLRQKNLLENAGDLKSAQIPSIFFGRFGSGDTAFRSGTHRDSLAKKHNIIAFEMEGAGVWDELPCIIVKGVSAYGDGHKTKHWADWQNFAAATAASVARALVERYPQTDKSPAAALELQENKACLNALFITNPEDDKQRIEETKGGLLLDAYIWITRSNEFIQWLEDPETRLLWIKGDPGKGKTMLLCGIINELKATKSGHNIYYFLCQATDIRLNNASAILRGLLHMIVVQHPSLISYIRDEYDKSGKSAFEGVNSWVVLSRIFGQMLRDDSLKEPLFLIDALDECVTDLAQLLEVIVKSSPSPSRVKWLVSSRNEADIQGVLAPAENKSTVSLELNAESVLTAITTYIRHKLELLSLKKGHKKPEIDHLEKYLASNAHGTFLWVALVCARLEKAPRFDRIPDTAEFPPGLDHLYERMISRVCDSRTSDLGRRVLAIATVAHRPLTKHEFVSLINNCDDDNDDDTKPKDDIWEDVLGHCGSFLTMRNGTVYFVHQSAKDFIVEHAVQRLFPNGTEFVHRQILKASISIMKKTLRKDIYGLADPAFSVDNLSQHDLSNDPLLDVRYCCLYWVDHFEKSITDGEGSEDNNSKSHDLIYIFLQEKYIYWLEALSLLKSLFDGIEKMRKLEQLVANSKTHGLMELAWDARRFVETFGSGIADFPLQLYISALVFSPSQSITRQLFGNETPEWIQPLPKGEVDWDLSSRIYEGRPNMRNLAASCCGTWIASSCDITSICIWEAYSGKLTQLLDFCSNIPLEERFAAHNFLRHPDLICFSPWIGEELASGLYENKVTIWDVATGKVLHRFQIGTDITSISYRTSARNILGCLTKDIALILNTKTGQVMEKIQLPKSETWAKSIFLTTDENIIARFEGERLNQLKFINIRTGNAKPMFKSDFGTFITHIQFTPDGSLLAVYVEKNSLPAYLTTSIITILDTISGETKWSFQFKEAPSGRFESSPAFTISTDGKLLAIGTIGGILVFSITSGICLRKITMKIRALLFSSDGKKLFCAQDDSALKVVEMRMETFIAPDLGNNPAEAGFFERNETIISPNGRFIASSFSYPPMIEVIDNDSGLPMQIPRKEINREGDIHMLFSPNSEKLALMSECRFILWDISTEVVKTIFMWEISFIAHNMKTAYRFSSNSEHLATAAYEYMDVRNCVLKLRVFHTDSGKCLMHLRKKKYADDVSLCFSPDDKRLAVSYLYDNRAAARVEIWEIASTSALRAIDLNFNDLNCHFSIPSSRPEARRPSNEEHWEQKESVASEEIVDNGKKDQKTEKMWNSVFGNFFFQGYIYLILDIHLGIPLGGRSTRFALRTSTDAEQTDEPDDDHFRFDKAKSYGVDSTAPWITFNRERLVWIPPEYQNKSIDVQQNVVALSRNRELLSIIQFRHDLLAKQVSPPKVPTVGHIYPLPERDSFTYLRELDDNWKIRHRDMRQPDGEMLHKIFHINIFRDTLSFARWKTRRALTRILFEALSLYFVYD